LRGLGVWCAGYVDDDELDQDISLEKREKAAETGTGKRRLLENETIGSPTRRRSGGDPKQIGEDTMYEIEMCYNNADGLFSHEQLICSIMNRWGGDEVGSGQGFDNMRDIMYEFDAEEDRQAAWEALQVALGDQALEVVAALSPEPEQAVCQGDEASWGWNDDQYIPFDDAELA
jgi:hypothetical protein